MPSHTIKERKKHKKAKKAVTKPKKPAKPSGFKAKRGRREAVTGTR